MNVNRIPPVDSNHCDMSAIMAELQYLRAEVRDVVQLTGEVAALQQEVSQLKQLVVARQETEYFLDVQNFHPLTTVVRDGTKHITQAKNVTTSVAAGRPVAQPKKQVRRPVIGTADSKVKSVRTIKTVGVFVSRLHPVTTEAELMDCVNDLNVKGDLKLHDVQCTRLKSRYEDLYSSMHVTIKVDVADFKNAVDLYMSAEAWPCAVSS